MKNYIERLENISSNTQSWGGKAVVLRTLLKYSLPIPRGIVLHTHLYEEYGNVRNQDVELNTFKKKLNDIIKISLEECDISEDIIFRSSANIEGNDDLCCSGIFESYLYYEEMEYADTAILVWESAYNSNVKKYLSDNVKDEELKMGVLIQPICKGEFSGVMQTCDIVQESNNMIIEYCSWRLEAVVDGTDNSERIILSDKGKIKSGLWKGKYDTLKKLFDLGKKVESILGSVVEIEFVTNEDLVFILQARRLERWY